MKTVQKIRSSKGFTLIELLIVIAVIGVLAAVVLVAIDPLEQLARARDTGRASAVSELGNATQAFYTSQGSVYPPNTVLWMTTGTSATTTNGLQASGEIKVLPTNPTYGKTVVQCTRNLNVQNYCFSQNVTDAIVYTKAESKAYETKGTCLSGQAWIVWSSVEGKTGLLCAAEPSAGASGLKPL